jgi:glutathionyl-hydroquinone reductase
MGQLVNGQWSDSDERPTDASGAYLRASYAFRHWVTADGSAGPTGESGYKAEPGRYHLFVAQTCPWAHRAAIYRSLKGLEDVITMSQADAPKSAGWSFTKGFEHLQSGDSGVFHLHQVYTAADPSYSGKVTVPTLWDRERRSIVNNESSEIIRMFDTAFDGVGANAEELCPPDLLAEIDEVNDFVYEHVNNGVYRTGFAKTQAAYEEAVAKVFKGLDWLEDRLSQQRYLAGSQITEADWRTFPTLVRFDSVYYSHFKCNIRRVQDYPNLSAYTRELFQRPGIAETCDMEAMKVGYYAAMPSINPSGIIPVGPDTSWLLEPHGRG